VDVVDVDEAFVGEGAPGEGEIRAEAGGIAGPEASDFAALGIEFAAQFAGDIDYTSTAVVVADIHDVINDPNIVRTGFGHAVGSDLAGVLNVADIEDVSDAADGDAVLGREIE